jgi:hypothetical protein
MNNLERKMNNLVSKYIVDGYEQVADVLLMGKHVRGGARKILIKVDERYSFDGAIILIDIKESSGNKHEAVYTKRINFSCDYAIIGLWENVK